jgi:hypothetical protein
MAMAGQKVKINRAPVLTLWAAVVAEHLGYDHAAALTLGKAVAGMNAQSKGRRLGIYEEPQEKAEEKQPKAPHAGEQVQVPLLGRSVPAVHTDQGLRALAKGQPINPDSVSRYFKQKFGERLPDVRAAMEALAKSYRKDALAKQAFALYERFRPAVPEGMSGWGAAGELDLNQIRALAKPKTAR